MAENPASSAQAAELPRFAVTDYRPDGGFELAGVTMLLSAMAIAGAILGFGVHLVSQMIYLILVFPILIGFLMGWVGNRMIKSGRVRSPLIGGLAGFVGGVLAMFMMHYFDYHQFKGQLADHPDLVALAHMTPAERQQVLRDDLTPQQRAELESALRYAAIDSFPKFMDMEAKSGVEINHTTSSGKGLNLGYTGSYIYWGIEILIVAGITFLAVKKAAAEPFCVGCGEWKKPAVLGFFSNGSATVSAGSVKSGDLNTMRTSMPVADPTNLRMTTYTCPACEGRGEVDVKLELLTVDGKGRVSAATKAFSRYPAEAAEPMQSLFSPMMPAAPPAAEPLTDAPPAA